MRHQAAPAIRTDHPPGWGCPEVAHARARYLAALKGRVRNGSYFTDERVRTALLRMLAAFREDRRPGS